MDVNDWLMQNAIRLAKNFNTPVFDWINIRLSEFTRWIRAGNVVIEEENAEIEKARKQRRR